MKNGDVSITIRHSQIWLITAALAELSSPEGAAKMAEKFPDINMEAFCDDLLDLANRIEKAAVLWQQKNL